jgi:hypothetical protein
MNHFQANTVQSDIALYSKLLTLYFNWTAHKKNKYAFIFIHQNLGQNHNIITVSTPFGSVEKSKYLGTAVTNQIYVHEDVYRWLNSVCFLLFSSNPSSLSCIKA